MFNLFMSDIPEPRQNTGTNLVVYADDVTLTISHEKIHTAETAAQVYLDEILQWLKDNNLILADKTQATLFTPDPYE